MYKSIRSHLRSATLIGVAAALTVAGLALAEGGSSTGALPAGAPPTKMVVSAEGPGDPMQNLTYAEFHVIDNGQPKVVRLDAGEVVSASDSSITIRENDGNEVTIPVDDKTQVLAGPTEDLAVGDLKAGQKVNVSHPEGGAAETIMVPPKPGDLPEPGDLPKGAKCSSGPDGVECIAPAGSGAAARKLGAPPPGGVGFSIVGPPPQRGN
jgi:hypothetical protein